MKTIDILVISGFVLWIISCAFFYKETVYLRQSKIYKGVVVGMESKLNSNGIGYKPKISYITEDGLQRSFTRSFGTNPPGLNLEEVVGVAQNVNTGEVKIATFGHRFGFALFVFCVGSSLLLFSLLFKIGSSAMNAIAPVSV
jgi:hypothetical protein